MKPIALARIAWRGLALTALAAASAQTLAADAPPYKVAFIDPLSGPFGSVGQLMLNHLRLGADQVNAAGGVLGGRKMEILEFDSKLSAQESQTALQSAASQGARVIFTGGSGSSVVAALSQAALRYNQRNPGKEVIVINHSSIDPDLTGKNCNFWYFQTEASTSMKMKALANFIKRSPEIKKIYLLNQDYAHGRQWAHYGREMVGLARPDIQFVGEQLHPIGKVKDFAPYVANVKSSGADSVITGNWGPDMTLLLKAAADAGMNLHYFNHSAGSFPGTVLAFSQAAAGELTWVAEWHPGQAGTPKVDAWAKAYKAKFNQDYLAPRITLSAHMLADGLKKAGSDEPAKLARAMEDLSFDTPVGTLRMRGEDHQLLLPQVVNTIAKVDGKKVTMGWEGTNYGFRTDASYSGNELAQGNACKMARP